MSQRVRALDRESLQGGRRPSHRYALADYGLSEADVLARFRAASEGR